jgi:FtsZ-binding cell division protein ZapB
LLQIVSVRNRGDSKTTQASRLEGTEYDVKTAADSRFFTEFVGALKWGRPEDNACNIDDLRPLCSEFGFEELLSTLDGSDAAPLDTGISSIHDESRRRVRDVEEKNLQFERDFGFLQQEVGDLHEVNLGLAAENSAQKQEKDALRKRPDESVPQFTPGQSRSDAAIKLLFQEFGTL